MACSVAQQTVDMLNSGGVSLYLFTNGYSDEINWMGFDPYFNPDENGSATIDLQMRNFDFKLSPSKVNDCCQVEWMEKKLQVIPRTTVRTAFSGTTVPFASLADVNELRGATAGSSLVWVSLTTGEHKFVNILSVSGTGFVVDEAITASVGDTIIRGGKHRIIGDCNTQYNETVTRDSEMIKRSYPVSIPIHFKLDKCDLSKDRLDYYTKDYDVQKFVNQEFGRYIRLFRSLFMTEIFFGKNIPADGVNGSQSLSLITGLQQEQNCINPTGNYADGEVFIHDVATWDCCATGNDCDVLKTFKKLILQKLRASGVYTGGKNFTALVNQSQIDELDLLSGAIVDVFGPANGLMTYTMADLNQADGVVYANRELVSIKFGSNKLEMLHSPYLSEAFGETPVMYIFPRHLVGLRQFFVDHVNDSMKVAIAKEGIPMVQMFKNNVTSQLTGADECREWRGNFTYFFIAAGMGTGAYQFIKNLRSCDSSACNPVNSLPTVDTSNYPADCVPTYGR